jgi:hypothetical protein
MTQSSAFRSRRLADALDSDAPGVPDRLLRAVDEAMGKQPSVVLRQEAKVRKAREVWAAICTTTGELEPLLLGYELESWSIRGRAEELVQLTEDDATTSQARRDLRHLLRTLEQCEDELVLLLTTFVVRYARAKCERDTDPAAVVAAGLKAVSEAAYQCRGLASLDFANEVLEPTQRAILAACGSPPGRTDERPLGTTAALEQLAMAIDRRSLGRLRGGPIVVPHSAAGRTRLHRFGATWPIDRYPVPDDLVHSDEPATPYRSFHDFEQNNKSPLRRRAPGWSETPRRVRDAIRASQDAMEHEIDLLVARAAATRDAAHNLSAELLRHRPTISEGLQRVTVPGLSDLETITADLQNAAEQWARMSGVSARSYGRSKEWIERTWFASSMKSRRETATVRPDDPPPAPLPKLPWNPAHPREGALLGALIPFTVYRACVNLHPHDEIEDLVMDGLSALIVAARGYGDHDRGDLAATILCSVEQGVFRSERGWRSCRETEQAFLPFPTDIHKAVLAYCPRPETIYQLGRCKVAPGPEPTPGATAASEPTTRAAHPPEATNHLPRVLQLVHQASDLELLRGHAQAALSLLAEADALCDAHSMLPRAIQGLIAYRVGHLRMRQEPAIPALLDAERNFQRACQLGEGLEPWAGIFHLAVLGRLAAMKNASSVPAFVAQRLARRWEAVIHRQAILDPSEEPDRDDPIVQRGSLEATQALGYALGLDLTAFEGLGSLLHELHLEQGWGFLVGPELADAHVRLPWAMLPTTLGQIRSLQPSAIAFTLPDRAHSALLWRPGCEHPETINRQHASVLTWVLQGRPAGNSGLDHSVWGRHATPDTRRELIQRTRELLADILNKPGETVLPRDLDGLLRIGPEVEIYGAVHGEHWRHY